MARSLSARAGSIQMTEGSLYKNILLFSVPLIFSQLLQVLFNMADVAVVGKFSSATALGSVGSTSTLVTLFTGFLIGLSNGVNVRVAQYLGARQEEDTRNCVHTALILCTLSGVVIAVLCFFLAAPMLELLKTKDDLLLGAVLYFRIYALGMPALGIFNFGNAVLSASGDTKRPLAYLTAAGILNVILNLFFVIVCKMAADGVALASIISQYLSAVLVLLHMTHLTDSCRVEWKLLRLHGGEAGRILGLGIPAGIQHMIFAVANLFIQVGINSFDSTIVSGNSAAVNVDNVIYNVMAAFYTACSTFMGQNLGAGKRDRVLKSYFIGIIYSFAAGAILGGALFLFGKEFLSLFTNEEAVVEAGLLRTRIMCFSYAVSAFMDCAIAANRGIGKSLVPTIIVVMGSCVFRIVWIYTVFAHFHTIPSLYLLYIFSWTITAIAEIICFTVNYRKLATNKI
mgnify:CR=1 FL=1